MQRHTHRATGVRQGGLGKVLTNRGTIKRKIKTVATSLHCWDMVHYYGDFTRSMSGLCFLDVEDLILVVGNPKLATRSYSTLITPRQRPSAYLEKLDIVYSYKLGIQIFGRTWLLLR